jgi:hypothetical protein
MSKSLTDLAQVVRNTPQDQVAWLTFASSLQESDPNKCLALHAARAHDGQSWAEVLRAGFLPVLPIAGIDALIKALDSDDKRLTQGSTTTPPPLMCVQDWDVEAACALGFCGWKSEGLRSVGEVEEFFARACFDADQRLGEAAACRWFLSWFDETPRQEMRRMLLIELQAWMTVLELCQQEKDLTPLV